jgi:hypothetical protein
VGRLPNVLKHFVFKPGLFHVEVEIMQCLVVPGICNQESEGRPDCLLQLAKLKNMAHFPLFPDFPAHQKTFQ